MKVSPIPFDIIASESYQPFLLGFLTEMRMQNMLSFCCEVNNLLYNIGKSEDILRCLNHIYSTYFENEATRIDFCKICPKGLETHITWIRLLLQDEVPNKNLFKYLQQCVYHYLEVTMYPSFLQSSYYKELIEYLKQKPITIEMVEEYPEIVCVMDEMNVEEGKKIEYKEAICLMELNRIIKEDVDVWNLYYYLSSYIGYYRQKKHSAFLTSTMHSMLVIEIQTFLKKFPYPYTMIDILPERESSLFRMHTIPSHLPPHYDYHALIEWKEEVVHYVSLVVKQYRLLIGSFLGFVNSCYLRVAANIVIELQSQQNFKIRARLESLLENYTKPMYIQISKRNYYFNQLRSETADERAMRESKSQRVENLSSTKNNDKSQHSFASDLAVISEEDETDHSPPEFVRHSSSASHLNASALSPLNRSSSEMGGPSMPSSEGSDVSGSHAHLRKAEDSASLPNDIDASKSSSQNARDLSPVVIVRCREREKKVQRYILKGYFENSPLVNILSGEEERLCNEAITSLKGVFYFVVSAPHFCNILDEIDFSYEGKMHYSTSYYTFVANNLLLSASATLPEQSVYELLEHVCIPYSPNIKVIVDTGYKKKFERILTAESSIFNCESCNCEYLENDLFEFKLVQLNCHNLLVTLSVYSDITWNITRMMQNIKTPIIEATSLKSLRQVKESHEILDHSIVTHQPLLFYSLFLMFIPSQIVSYVLRAVQCELYSSPYLYVLLEKKYKLISEREAKLMIHAFIPEEIEENVIMLAETIRKELDNVIILWCRSETPEILEEAQLLARKNKEDGMGNEAINEKKLEKLRQLRDTIITTDSSEKEKDGYEDIHISYSDTNAFDELMSKGRSSLGASRLSNISLSSDIVLSDEGKPEMQMISTNQDESEDELSEEKRSPADKTIGERKGRELHMDYLGEKEMSVELQKNQFMINITNCELYGSEATRSSVLTKTEEEVDDNTILDRMYTPPCLYEIAMRIPPKFFTFLNWIVYMKKKVVFIGNETYKLQAYYELMKMIIEIIDVTYIGIRFLPISLCVEKGFLSEIEGLSHETDASCVICICSSLSNMIDSISLNDFIIVDTDVDEVYINKQLVEIGFNVAFSGIVYCFRPKLLSTTVADLEVVPSFRIMVNAFKELRSYCSDYKYNLLNAIQQFLILRVFGSKVYFTVDLDTIQESTSIMDYEMITSFMESELFQELLYAITIENVLFMKENTERVA